MNEEPRWDATPTPPGPPGPGWWLATDGRYYPPAQPSPDMAPQPFYSTMPPQTSTTNGFSIAALVLGILWLYWVGSILALVFGYVARSQIKRSGGRQGGNGLAIAGIVLGWIGVATIPLVVVLAIVAANSTNDINSDPHDGYCNTQRYYQDPDC